MLQNKGSSMPGFAQEPEPHFKVVVKLWGAGCCSPLPPAQGDLPSLSPSSSALPPHELWLTRAVCPSLAVGGPLSGRGEEQCPPSCLLCEVCTIRSKVNFLFACLSALLLTFSPGSIPISKLMFPPFVSSKLTLRPLGLASVPLLQLFSQG